MRKLIAFCMALLALAACSPLLTETPQRTTTLPTPAAPSATSMQGAAPATQVPQAAASVQPAAGGVPVALQVLSPQDGAVVNTPQIQVSGTASPGAVVTVNDTIILVGADGGFSAAVALDAGPNLVDVIASNDSGDSKTVDLTVTYQQ